MLAAHLATEPDPAPWFRSESGPWNPFGPQGKLAFTVAAVKATKVFVVEGSGDFPVDMLRYDRAFCLTPIPHPDHPWFGKRLRVVCAIQKNFKPTEARWNSFGWRVLSGSVDKAAGNNLKANSLLWRGQCSRCRQECQGYARSWFQQRERLCAVCEAAERAHPDFDLARNSLRCAFAQRNYTFEGVGWPGPQGRLQ